jgi:dihydrofolate reductase
MMGLLMLEEKREINMRKLVVTEFLTLDGVMEAPGTETSLGELGGWSFPFWNDEATRFKHDEILASDALLLGRTTYEIFASFWPTATDDTGFADRMNQMPKYVVSSKLQTAEWNNSTLIKGTIAEEVAKLKGMPGQEILLQGSADLVRDLMPLIDEFRLMIFPVVLGRGKRLFGEGIHQPFQLADFKTFATGAVLLTYQSAI